MMCLSRRLMLGLVTAAVLGAVNGAAAQESWFRYCNARFGQCADIPKSYKSDPPPENGDGLRFLNGNGMSVTVSASYNALNQTLAEQKAQILESLARPSLQSQRDNWFVVSGSDGKTIYYIKMFVTRDNVSTLWMEYPAADARSYDQVVTRISKSFTPAKR